MDNMVITSECLRFISINVQETNVVLFPSLEILNVEKLALVMVNYLFYHDWAGQSQCSHRKHIKQGLGPACCYVGSGCFVSFKILIFYKDFYKYIYVGIQELMSI